MTIQNNISTHEMALQVLKDGNTRFFNNTLIERDYHYQLKNTSKVQSPFAVILSCIDSRIPTEIIFDKGIGDIFNVRIAGNIVNSDILGSMEYACKISSAKLILVLGHTDCGAVKGACSNVDLENLTGLLNKLKPAIAHVKTELNIDCDIENSEMIEKVAVKNVELTIEDIKNKSTVLEKMIKNNEIGIAGAMYNVGTGKVTFL